MLRRILPLLAAASIGAVVSACSGGSTGEGQAQSALSSGDVADSETTGEQEDDDAATDGGRKGKGKDCDRDKTNGSEPATSSTDGEEGEGN